MIIDPIRTVLSGILRLSESGKRVHCPIRRLVIEPSLDGRERDLLQELGFQSSPTIVCDPSTHDVLAKRVALALPGAKLAVLEAPEAAEATARELMDQTRHANALVAVGSGTLNDLVKYVSHRRRQPYAVFATAPSMNGYVTATASISRDGEKLSLPATPPLAAFFDLAILADAPQRLIRAGVGDSLCRSTAEFDWRLSHYLVDTEFMETPFTLQTADEAELLSRVSDLEAGDIDAVMALVRLLVLGGLGMLIAGSSQPGSQGEHLISHFIDMVHRPHPGSLHGEQVGVATWTMATLQQQILNRHEPPVLSETVIDRAGMKNRFGTQSASCHAAMSKKALKGDRLDALNQRLTDRWSELQRVLEAKALPLERLQAAFEGAGVITDPNELGIAPSFYGNAVLHARELRDRFTTLDLAADAGILGRFVDQHVGS